MDQPFSLSVFTVEINGRPTVALRAKRHQEAERFCEQERLRAESTLTSDGVPLFDANADLKVRLANPAEADLYRRATPSTRPSDELNIVYLVDHLDRRA